MLWKKVKLTDISKPKQWKSLPISELASEGYAVYGANGVIGRYKEYNHEFPTLAITCRGATCGKINITEPKSYITSNAMALDSISEDVDQMFLYYALNKRGFKDVITGAAQPQITREGLNKIVLNIPESKEYQHYIADLLSKAEKLVKQRKESINLLNELLKTLFIDMFGDPVRNEKGWKKDKIGSNCKVTKLAGYEYSKHVKYSNNGEIIVVKGLNVKDGRIRLDNISFIDKSTSDFLIRSKLFKGDIVMTYIGINIGDVAIVEDDNKFHLAPNVCKITPLSFDIINSYFLLYYLMYNRRLFVKGTTDTAKPSINMSEIREIEILLPPIELQSQFALIVEKTESIKTQCQKSLQDLENLYGSLSQKAFRGELSIKQSNSITV